MSASRIVGAAAAAAVLLVAGGAAAPGGAVAAWSPPRVVPAPATGSPHALIAGTGGSAIVVWANDPIYQGAGPVTVDVVRAGGSRARWSTQRSIVVDWSRTSAGDLDLLTEQGARPAERPGRLVLYRVVRSGAVRRLWSAPFGGGSAAIARRGARVAIAWLDRVPRRADNPGRLVLRLTTRTQRGWFATRTIGGVLPRWLNGADSAFVEDLGLALDRNGRAVFAVTAWHRPAPTLVLATTTLTGRLLSRQLTTGVEGLITMRSTPTGRLAALAEDTGIEGEVGECVGDGKPRRIWAAAREAGALRFGTTSLLDSQQFVCSAARAQLIAGPRDELGVLWGVGADGVGPQAPDAPPAVRAAFAAAGQGFGAASTLWTAATLRAATSDATGALAVALTRPTRLESPYSGSLVTRSLAFGGPPQAAEDVHDPDARTVLMDSTPAGEPVLAWTDQSGALHLSVRQS